MIKIAYAAILLIVGVVVAAAGACKISFSGNFAEKNPEYTEKQHKLIGAAVIAAGAALAIFGLVMCFSQADVKNVEEPKKTFCNVCGGDLLCDVCGADGPYCEYSVTNTGDGAHYCEEHWNY